MTRNHRQIWRLHQEMRWLVLSIVGGVYEQVALRIRVRVDDWTVKRAIIASNVTKK